MCAGGDDMAMALPCAPLESNGIAVTKTTAVDEWLTAHKALITKEVEFSEVAMKAAFGAITPEELAAARQELEGMRERCSEIYRRAFPGRST